MQREILKNLLDIKESIDSIFDYLGDKKDLMLIKQINYYGEESKEN